MGPTGGDAISRHTPRPWQLSNLGLEVWDSDREMVAVMADLDEDAAKANARLIAAAPELLEAARHLLDLHQLGVEGRQSSRGYGTQDEALARSALRAATAKAEGGGA